MDLVINCIPDRRLVAERAVLRGGGLLLNIASLPLAARLELEAEEDSHASLVILHGGLTPGATTLVFNALLADHPDADELEYAWASSALQSSGPGPALR